MTKKKILALTACPVGIAHTYIAQEKLETSAKALGYDIKVETHGSIGLKNEITPEDVATADLIIVAVAAGASDLRLERFINKPMYQVEITKVIKNPDGVIKEAFEKARHYTINKSEKTSEKNEKVNDIFSSSSSQKKGIMKHIMAGVGYMVPFVVFGGIMIALSAGISQIIYGPGGTPPYPHFLWFMSQAGSIGFQLMIPILAGFIANSIAGRAALAPAMITAFIANITVPNPNNSAEMITLVYPIAGLGTQTPAGFLGALLIGPAVGYTVKWITTWKVPKVLQPVMPIFVIPILVTFTFSFIFIYAIGAPIGWVMGKFSQVIAGMPPEAMAAIGLLLGAMAGFDMGGPVNKVAFLTASGLIKTNPTFMGALAAGIPVAPLGMGLTTLIFRKHFNNNERGLGITALFLGMIGISEGAIPFAIRDPKRAIISNVIGSAVAGAIAGAFFVTDLAAHGGPIVGILGAIGSSKYETWVGIMVFFIAILVGTLVTCFLYGFLLTIQSKNIKVFHEISEWFKRLSEKIKTKFKKSNKKKNKKPNTKKHFTFLKSENYLLNCKFR